MQWTRISPRGNTRCASDGCPQSAKWHAEAGGVGSDYCSGCRDSIIEDELRRAAIAVVAYDWSDSDADAVAAIERLRQAVNV